MKITCELSHAEWIALRPMALRAGKPVSELVGMKVLIAVDSDDELMTILRQAGGRPILDIRAHRVVGSRGPTASRTATRQKGRSDE